MGLLCATGIGLDNIKSMSGTRWGRLPGAAGCCGALRCVPLLDQMGQSAERFLYPPAVAVCPRCIEVSLQSTVFHSGLDWAHGSQRNKPRAVSLVFGVPTGKTPAVLLAGDTAILMRPFGAAFKD